MPMRIFAISKIRLLKRKEASAVRCGWWRVAYSEFILALTDLVKGQLQLGRLLCAGQHEIATGVVHAQVVDVEADVKHLGDVLHAATAKDVGAYITSITNVCLQQSPINRTL